MSSANCTDAMLMEILQERKTITGFLDAIFGFLRRNTDFYHIKKSESDKIGFPEGVRDKILYGCMQRFNPDNYVNIAKEDENELFYADEMPPISNEIVLDTSGVLGESPAKTIKPKTTTIAAKNNKNDSIFSTSDYKNGAVFANYCWSQTLNDIELHVVLPQGLNTSKFIHIDIKSDSIKIYSRTDPKNVIVAGQLWDKYKHNEAVWTIDDGQLTINLDKSKEMWWDKLFTHEPCIDIKKLDCERYIDELPEDSQAQINKLRIEQMERDAAQENLRKKCDADKIEQLRKAWDSDGSPFKGQPFDPSVLYFT